MKHSIQNLTANPLKIKPAVLQVELTYYNPQPELIKVGSSLESSLMLVSDVVYVVPASGQEKMD